MTQQPNENNSQYTTPSAAIIVAERTGTITLLSGTDGAIGWRHSLGSVIVSDLVGTSEIICVATHTSPLHTKVIQAHIHAFHARTGQLAWQISSPDLIGPYHLALTNDMVILSSSEDDGAIRAIDVTSGNIVWMYGNAGSLRDRLLFAKEGIVYVLDNDPPFPPHVTALMASSGQVLWHRHASFDERVVGYNGPGIALANSDADNHYTWNMLDSHTGSVRYKCTLPKNWLILHITDDDVTYIMEFGAFTPHDIYAVRMTTGGQLWHYSDVKPTRPFRGIGTLQVSVSDGILCFSQLIHDTWMAEITAIDVDTGARIWEWQSLPGLNSSINAMRLVSGKNTAYLSTSKGILAFRNSDGTLLWHALPKADLSFLSPIVLPESYFFG